MLSLLVAVDDTVALGDELAEDCEEGLNVKLSDDVVDALSSGEEEELGDTVEERQSVGDILILAIVVAVLVDIILSLPDDTREDDGNAVTLDEKLSTL